MKAYSNNPVVKSRGGCSGGGIEANDTILNIYMLNQSIPVDQGPMIFGLQIKSLIPPMVGSFFGVIMAFALNYKYQSYNNNKDKIYKYD